MRRITIVGALLVGAVIYAGSPLLAAWEVRQALKTGDKVTLEQRVDWPSVRTSLHQSLGEAQQVINELTEAAGVPKPSLWRRVVAATVPMLTGTVIDSYVTPEGAPQLYAWRQTWREKVRPTIGPAIGLSEPRMVLAGTAFEGTAVDKTLSLLRRVDRAAFTGPTRLELEVRDRYAENRRWRAVMELRGMTWKLTEVHVLAVPAPKPAEISLGS
jgi:Protein of unknown function (DUF2939)